MSQQQDSHPASPVMEKKTGDLFTATTSSIIVHSCNCEGVWGKGIAATMKANYEAAFEDYRRYTEQDSSQILGHVVLSEAQHPQGDTTRIHRVASLLVKEVRGRPKSRQLAASVVANTTASMTSLLEKLVELESQGETVGDICMPKINAGIFGIPWKETETAIRSIRVARATGEPFRIVVYSRESDE